MIGTRTWGYHLLCDCTAGDKARITDADNIVHFVRRLVEAIDMTAYGETMIDHFATHDPDKAGHSFCQMIETSNITGHFVDKNGNFYIDVFSCKPFEVETVLSVIDTHFAPERTRVHFIGRDA